MKATFGQIKNGYSSIFIKKKKSTSWVLPTVSCSSLCVCVTFNECQITRS